ncbi:MAG: ribonuclease Y [Phycisphaerales bacterium JB040]
MTPIATLPLVLALQGQTPPLGPSQGGSSGFLLPLILGLVIGAAVALGVLLLLGRQRMNRARSEARELTERARAEANNAAEKIRLEAEREALERKEKAESELEAGRAELREQERRMAKREDTLDRREETITNREDKLDSLRAELEAQKQDLTAKQADLEGVIAQQTDRLHQLSGLSKDQAKELLLERVSDSTRDEVGRLVRELTEEAEQEAREKAREITIQAIQRYSTETVSDSTVRTVAIPSDDMKGRIIGREGRNIRAIEKATGADIIVDDTPGVIVVSCFDKVRQAVAVEALERLIADGRLHPSRIEEVVDKVQKETDERIQKYGKEAALEVKLKGFHPKISEAMGKLHYRTSYGQNVLKHSIEVAYFSQIIADQLGLDGRLARRCGYLHDIGKAMDHEMEGGHPAIGMNFAKQYGEKEEAVLNAIGGHHADIPATTLYTPIVMAADALSSARPGARRDSMERYVQRLTELEDIAKSQPGVKEAHAIQAGREVRVMIDADRVSDDEAYLTAHEIAKRVSDEMTFPGEIKVTVLRETRAIEIAR